jgi:hypothetical protein
MPTPKPTTARASSAREDGLDALWRLSVKGAYAVPAETSSAAERGPYAVFSPRNTFAQALAIIPAAAFALARRRGWVEPEAGGGRYHLAATGLKVLRQAKSGQATPAAGTHRHAAATRTTPTRAPQERPLAWLRRRKDKDGRPLVTEPQFDAGERLAADFWHAQLMPRVTANWSAVATSRRTRRAAPGAGVEIGDNVAAARQRVHRALDAVGPELAGILVDVCCHEIGLEAAERALGWPQRSAKLGLQLALTSLARHYGLLPPPPSWSAHRMRHWGSEDYRPDLEAWR